MPSGFVPNSKDIPWLKVAVDSCSTRITFSNSVSRTFVFESNPLTVPTWEDNVLPDAKVPDTSLRTKWALGVTAGTCDVE